MYACCLYGGAKTCEQGQGRRRHYKGHWTERTDAEQHTSDRNFKKETDIGDDEIMIRFALRGGHVAPLSRDAIKRIILIVCPPRGESG